MRPTGEDSLLGKDGVCSGAVTGQQDRDAQSQRGKDSGICRRPGLGVGQEGLGLRGHEDFSEAESGTPQSGGWASRALRQGPLSWR